MSGFNDPRFPPELDSSIISYLADDPASLRNCSLVCHALLTASRQFKFEEVTLKYQDDVVRLREVLLASPELGQHVRSVKISPPAQYVTRPKTLAFKMPEFRSDLITTHVRSHPRGKVALYSVGPEMSRKSTQLLLDVVPSFKSAVKLSLSACHISGHDLAAIISTMDRLEEVALLQCEVIPVTELFTHLDSSFWIGPYRQMYSWSHQDGPNTESTSATTSTSPVIRRLVVSPSLPIVGTRLLGSDAVLDYLIAGNLWHNVQSLVLIIPDKPTLRAAERLIRELAHSVLKLHLAFNFNQGAFDEIRLEETGSWLNQIAKTISKENRLQELILVDVSTSPRLRWLTVIEILRHLSCSSLEHLHVEPSRETDDDDEEPFAFHAGYHGILAEILGATNVSPTSEYGSRGDFRVREPENWKLPGLKRVDFVYYGQCVDEWKGFMAETYFGLERRGVLGLVAANA
ncbi:hypothetical protein BXZ70DRAFT_1005365 [Cristinia sonorae]|uniref:Uncharacterized protein n=1 Tax=Cristinia sonorae TaxID=1940300 RepID=A0A8K0XSC6_9AGAR|nr:hypothetical protein BXZ70DRAFT_1005365 [Cristinia sonorae]